MAPSKKVNTPNSGSEKVKTSCGQPRATKQMKKQKPMTGIIYLSSSSYPKSENKKVEIETNDIASEASTPDIKGKYESKNVDEEQDANGTEELKVAFNTIASMIIRNNPDLGFTMSPSGLPIITSKKPTPLDSSSGQRNETEKIMDKLKLPAEIVTPSAPQDTNIKRSLFSKFEQRDNNDFYINFEPLSNFGYEGRTTGVVIPEWIPTAIKPPSDMILNDIEAAVAAYIFMTDEGYHHGYEILIETNTKDTGSTFGNRKTLKTLMPKGWVDQEVLNLLACKLTYIGKLSGPNLTMWFLPTTFAQYVLEWGQRLESTMVFFRHHFMSKADNLEKIFVPINDQNIHWYLLVVDLHKRKLLLLDSLPSPERKEYRKIKVKKLALSLQEILLDNSFYDQPTEDKPAISDFNLDQPKGLRRQRIGSNDCGVWVAEWMKGLMWHDDYDKILVQPATRMRLALDLVLHPYNKMEDEVIQNAFQLWSDQEKKRKKLVKF